jgi:hypothetical protein
MKENEAEEQERRAKEHLSDLMQRAIKLRSVDREFHGLDREFLYLKADMLAAYEKSKDIKHPRDVGSAREEILRTFLANSGYLPKRYAVSENSARIASTSGHVTGEMDILLYDPTNSIRLMNRENVYDVYPAESVYGAIQVKSRLNKKEIREGLENVAAFKALDREPEVGGFRIIDGSMAARGFGILFAYDSDLKWTDIAGEIESFSKTVPQRQWCNVVYILSRGMFLLGDGTAGRFTNDKIDEIVDLQTHGYPDRDNTGLFQFYSILMTLLRHTGVQSVSPDSYFRLPLVSDALSYEFVFGPSAEIGTCQKHGDFQRKIRADNLKKIVDWCDKAEPMNWIKATDLAYGKPGDDQKAYDRQPGDIRIYNPEMHPLPDILVMDSQFQGKDIKSLAFDQIRTSGMVIYIPYYYCFKEGLISDCPKCPILSFDSASGDPGETE